MIAGERQNNRAATQSHRNCERRYRRSGSGACVALGCAMKPWLKELTERVREASKAFKRPEDWPDAWLYFGKNVGEDWYDCDQPLLGRPVFHGVLVSASGYNGEQPEIVPLWTGDTSTRCGVQREFQCRMAGSGDF